MGVFMRLGSPEGVEAAAAQGGEHCETDPAGGKHKQGCCSVLDAADARRVAGLLGMPFYVLNFQEDFGRVIDYFVDEYNRGRTPNPCVRCNDWLKFGKLAKYAEGGRRGLRRERALRAGRHRSGHRPAAAAARARSPQGPELRPVRHVAAKRWSTRCCRSASSRSTQVRAIAEELKLPVFNKPDSQEICFVPNQDYAGAGAAAQRPRRFRAGELVTPDGEVVGTHEGHQHFTIGQRKGVGVAMGYPLYVLDIDPAANRVTVGERDDLARLARSSRGRSTSSSDRCAPATGRSAVHGQDPLQPPAAAGDGDGHRRRRDHRPLRRAADARSRRGRRSCCTMATWCWAAGGSTRWA